MSSPDQLIAGFKRFRTRYLAEDSSQFKSLVEDGQSPSTLVVACCDSRVDPALILDCEPGDLFVIRNVANLVPPNEKQGHFHGTSAALEFGVRNLKVQHIIVLGHTHCGGIRTLLQGKLSKDAYFVTEWMKITNAARMHVEQEHADTDIEQCHRICEQESILVSLQNLTTFPWIREPVEQGSLTLHGWYFDIEHGELLGYNTGTQQFGVL